MSTNVTTQKIYDFLVKYVKKEKYGYKEKNIENFQFLLSNIENSKDDVGILCVHFKNPNKSPYAMLSYQVMKEDPYFENIEKDLKILFNLVKDSMNKFMNVLTNTNKNFHTYIYISKKDTYNVLCKTQYSYTTYDDNEYFLDFVFDPYNFDYVYEQIKNIIKEKRNTCSINFDTYKDINEYKLSSQEYLNHLAYIDCICNK